MLEQKKTRIPQTILFIISLLVASLACGVESSPNNQGFTPAVSSFPTKQQELYTPTFLMIETPTPLPLGNATVIASSINLRSGPGTNFAIVGNAKQGDVFPVFGQDKTGDWIQVDWFNYFWISTSLLDLDIENIDLPIADERPLIKETQVIKQEYTLKPSPTKTMVTTWQGVFIGMPADDVLLIHPGEEMTSPPEQIGSDADGLIVRWSYTGAYLKFARRNGSCPTAAGGSDCYCYRVLEITLR